jgi:hypothetical protein
MSDPRLDPTRPDPLDPAVPPRGAYSDPAADPRVTNHTVVHNTGRGGLIAAGVIAALLVIALIAFSSGPGTDPATTATVPDQQTEELAPAPADPVAPAPAPEAAPAPAPEAPVDEAPAAVPPADEQAPAADQ